jgi:hypothetical protein
MFLENSDAVVFSGRHCEVCWELEPHFQTKKPPAGKSSGRPVLSQKKQII